jgi:hypothetical protein
VLPIGLIDTIATVYTWVASVLIILSLFLIARFYEVKSGQRSHYRIFLVAAALFLLAGVLSAVRGTQFVGDPLVDTLLFLAGAVTILLSTFLYQLMTRGRR